MKNGIKIMLFVFIIAVLAVLRVNCSQGKSKKMSIAIILGSTRKGRSSDKIGNVLKAMADKRSDIVVHLVDLRDFNLPFFNDEIAPASRTVITDPVTQKWSDTIQKADAFIIVSPEYNGGYPGVLKNALDSLYKEWNKKPVGFVVYSGGSSGGTSAVGQLRQVAKFLEMIPVAAEIKIPNSWKAFDEQGNLIHPHIETEFDTMINQLLKSNTQSNN